MAPLHLVFPPPAAPSSNHWAISRTAVRDLTRLRLRHVPADQVWSFITEDRGGVAKTFLAQLCDYPGRPFRTTTLSEDELCEAGDLVANLQWAATAQRSSPRSTSRARKSVTTRYIALHEAASHHPDERVPVKKLLHHAVLIVGHRAHPDGSVHFLIQNWWKQKQLQAILHL